MADIYDWSLTPITNASADADINWAEGMDPDQVNDSARQMMTRVAEVLDDIAPTRSTTGTGNAYAVVTAAVTSGSYNDGEIIACIIDRANTSACTLNSNGRGAVAWRPEVGREFAAGELRANQPVLSFYRSASNEFLAVGSGYHVNALTSGVLTQSVVGRLLKIGTPVLSLAPTAAAGYIRLTEATQTLTKTAWPELSSYLSSISYPWGSTSTTFNLPPAAGYFLRFAPTSSAIDTAGSRSAGQTQADTNKAHTHTASATSSVSDPAHSHPQTVSTSGFTGPATGGGVTAYAWGGTQNSGQALTGITVSTSVTVASDGNTEVRTKNVAMHVDIFASAALATGTLGQFGFSYAFDTSITSSDPGAGTVRLNHATPGSATALYISETDGWGTDISGFLSTIANGVRLRLSKLGAQNNTVLFTASGAPTDNGTWQTIPGAVTVASGSFAAADTLAFEQFSGAAGAVGSTGAAGSDGGFKFTFDSSTTMGNPAAGGLRLNNATLGSVTAIAIASTSADTGNPAVDSWIESWDDSTTTAHRGVLYIREASASNNQIILDVTSAVTDNSTWLTCTVAVISSSGTLTNGADLLVSFSRTGDKGADGAGSGTVTSITAGAGLSNNGVGATGGAITTSGTLTAVEAVNPQTGTSYTILSGDHTKLVTLSNTSPVAVTVPQATSSFGAGFYFDIANLNNGPATLTPTTSTINGAASFVLNRFQSVRVISDGTNWQVMQGTSLRGQSVTVASATTCDIGAVASHRVSISGTTTITGFGTVPNQIRFGSFTGILTLTHHATSLILPGGANITTAAGDTFIAWSDASGNWTVMVYQKASGAAVVGGSGSGSPSIPQGRLTLTSATPVLTSTVTGATTIYYALYSGRYVPLYNGSAWTMTDIAAELSQATTDSTKSPAGCANNSNYDLFVWDDGGTYRCTRGPAWSSDTARGTGAGTTELERVNGIYVNKIAITNGPAAQRGTYVGTIRTNGTSTVDWIYGAIAAGGTAGSFGVWNMYNRCPVSCIVGDTTDTWTRTAGTTGPANAGGSGSGLNQRVSFISGLAEDVFYASYSSPCLGSGGGSVGLGIGVDSTTTLTGRKAFNASTASVQNFGDTQGTFIGFHYLQAMEWALTGTGTFAGDGGAPTLIQQGLLFSARM